MAEHGCKTMDVGYVRDQGTAREQVWSALMADWTRREAEAASREEVLRELLDDAHERIRSLEAALQRLAAAAVGSDPEASSDAD